jgi:hypothetical protein
MRRRCPAPTSLARGRWLGPIGAKPGRNRRHTPKQQTGSISRAMVRGAPGPDEERKRCRLAPVISSNAPCSAADSSSTPPATESGGLSPDDVVHLEDLGLARLDAKLGQERHKPRAERV